MLQIFGNLYPRNNMSVTSVVIGCNSDIGSEIVRVLVDRGDCVIGGVRSLKECAQVGGENRALIQECNVEDLESVKKFFSNLEGREISNLIYCSGVHYLSPISPFSSGTLDKQVAVNLIGMINCARYFVSKKFESNNCRRSFTAIASIAHRVAEAGLIGYSASKAGMVAAIRGLAVENASRNIRFNSISPGWIEGRRAEQVRARLSENALSHIKERYLLGFGEPADVANAVDFLSSDKSKWITGVDLIVDGGRSCH